MTTGRTRSTHSGKRDVVSLFSVPGDRERSADF